MPSFCRSRPNVLGWLALATYLASFFLWQVSRIHIFQFSNDEGTILMWVRMARAGYPLYSSTWADQPPGLMMLLAAAFSLFGESVTVARMISLGFATLGLLAVALVTREVGGWGASMASVFLLSICPSFYWYSRPVMQDIPALSLAAIALALALLYRRSKGRTCLWLSGLAFGLGLVVKLMTVPLLAPVGVILLATHMSKREIRVRSALLDLLRWAMGAALPIGLAVLTFHPPAMMHQVIGTATAARGTYGLNLMKNLVRFRDLVLEGNVGLIALALVGLMAVLRRPTASVWAVLIWMGTALVAPLMHVPLWSHHLVMVLMPVAVLAGVGVSTLSQAVRPSRSDHRADIRLAWLLLGLLAVMVYLASIPTILRINSEETTRFERMKWEVLARLRQLTEPGDFAVSDMGLMTFRAGLLCPPTTVDLSEKRIESGLLTDQDVLEATFRYPVKAVVFWTSRQYRIPDYVAWVDHNYQHVFQDGRSRHIYVAYEGGPVVCYPGVSARSATEDAAGKGMECTGASPQISQLEDGVTLVGYSLAKPTVQAGEEIHLTLFWKARERVKGNYTVFTHLIDDTGKLWGQKDNPPGAGGRPTNSWQPGVFIVDNYAVPVDPETPPGSYQIEVGMYELASGRRLMVLDAEGRPRDNRVLLGSVTVR